MTAIGAPQKKGHQVFLSYAQADREIAQRIAHELRDAGLHVRFSDWELRPGDSIVEKAEQALSATDLLLVLLSRQSVQSRWVQSELSAALSDELRSRAVTVVPAIIEDCEIPPVLASLSYVDLRDDFEGGLARLIRRIGVAPAIDFSRLSPREFEEMVASLLVALGFSVSITPASRDNGIDLVASYNSTDPFGAERKESWLVVAKLYNKQRVSVTTLRQMIGNLVMARGQHKGLMVTTGQLTSVASEFLNELSFSSRADLRVIDGSELTQLLLQHPEVVRGYFPVDAGK